MFVALCAILSNFFAANSALYSSANDPKTAKDPQNGLQTISDPQSRPQMILKEK